MRARAKSASISATFDAAGVGSAAEVADASAGSETAVVDAAVFVGTVAVAVDTEAGLAVTFVFSMISAVCCASCWFIISCKDYFGSFTTKSGIR